MAEQRNLDELRRMTRDEVHAAFKNGELDDLLGRTPSGNGHDPKPKRPASPCPFPLRGSE